MAFIEINKTNFFARRESDFKASNKRCYLLKKPSYSYLLKKPEMATMTSNTCEALLLNLIKMIQELDSHSVYTT